MTEANPIEPAPIEDPVRTGILDILKASADAEKQADALVTFVAEQVGPLNVAIGEKQAELAAVQIDLDKANKALASAIDPNASDIEGTREQWLIVQRDRVKAELDSANTRIDLMTASGNADLTAARQALKDQQAASAAAILKLQQDQAAAIAAKDAAMSALQAKLDAAKALAVKRKAALGNVMAAVTKVVDVVNPLLAGE